MKRIITGIIFILTLCQAATAQDFTPQIIPALREWEASKGILTMLESGHIIVNDKDAKLLSETAAILADDISKLVGWDYDVRIDKPHRQDIVLKLDAQDRTLGNEGYRLTISDKVIIEAATITGVFWCTRSLLQMFHKYGSNLHKGTARDWPEFPSRGFMLDVGRKFFSLEYLEQQIKILSFYKMNEFQIHLNDNGFVQFFDNDWNKTYSAFRLESERYPGLTAKDGHYTKEEFRQLQLTAAKYGVKIIPEIDIPAHSLAFSHYKPEIGSQKYGMDHLDLYSEETYNFIDNLLDEYLGGDNPIFVCSDIHIGTDEYNQNEAERYRYFTDRYLKYIASYGKNPRMWGGLKWLPGQTPVYSDGVTINAWSYDWVEPYESLEAGYKLINTCDTYLYIVPGAGYYREFLDHKWIYEKWTPWMMNSQQTLKEGTPGVLGGMFAVWNDQCGNGISEQDVHYRSFPALQVMAEKLWKNGNPDIDFKQFESLCIEMPEAPGVNLLAKLKGGLTQLIDDNELTFNGKDTVHTGLAEIGYPYKVTFLLYQDSDKGVSQALFKGPHSTVYTNWENTGKLAFERDGYVYSFSYLIPDERWIEIAIVGDWKGTTLFVDGKEIERLEGRKRRVYNPKYDRLEDMPIQQTLIFPLYQVGDRINGFKGKIKELRVEHTDK